MLSKLGKFIGYSTLLTPLLILGTGIQAQAGQIVTANRASGNISVIDVETKSVFNVSLPGVNPEPMYVLQVPGSGAVAVGDRANNRVVFFNQTDYSVIGTATAGNGIFHMWGNPQGTQLWVVNDIDKSLTVINPQTRQLLATIPIPADLVTAGGIPHDIVLDNDSAFVTVALPSATDQVVKFSTSTFTEVARQAVGESLHVSLTTLNNALYVPSQGTNQVAILDRTTLAPIVSPLTVPGAHGAEVSPDGNTFYVTNIGAPGGNLGLWTIDTTSNTLIGSGVNTPAAVPHNLTLTDDGREIYISHSGGTSNLVSFYSIQNQVPTLTGSVNVGGFNPFGIAFIASVPEPSSVAGLVGFVAVIGINRLRKTKN